MNHLREKSDPRYPKANPLYAFLYWLLSVIVLLGVITGATLIWHDRTFIHKQEINQKLEDYAQLRVGQILADKQVLKIVCAK